jgi:hypothetical protein
MLHGGCFNIKTLIPSILSPILARPIPFVKCDAKLYLTLALLLIIIIIIKFFILKREMAGKNA